ncbi:MAG: alcohol dehydrogenase catalytic domain-containing protein [Chloroflexi bacterium]|nr:alcohol dehydrogenase catalytic domain-containing protein [Chloroflexota bacterium]MCZ6891755.1 alcohol dehydrogenase catalytic domain-containing protein [Chloroflexota bacterium]
MKAAVLYETGGPEVLKIEEMPMPRPGPTQVLVKVAAAGMCGHDHADRTGITRTERPVILGHEVSGVVVEVGEKVSHFQPGDSVASKQFASCGRCVYCRSMRDLQCSERRFARGGFAEYVALDDQIIIKIPEGVDLEGASIAACAVGSCLRALRQSAKVVHGETVVITGAGGGLGVHGLQVAKALGAHTIAVTSSPHKVEALREYGADQVVLAQGADYWRDIVEANNGEEPQVVIDTVGHPDVFTACFRALGRHGRYVFIGQVYRQKVELYPAIVLGKEVVITGSAATRMNEFLDAMEMVRLGTVRPVFQSFPLAQVVEASRQMDDRKVFGRTVLVP